MYLEDFTELVKIELLKERKPCGIVDLNWKKCGRDYDNDADKWREISYEKPSEINDESGLKIHYEFTRRGYGRIYFEVHCHHTDQITWDKLRKGMKLKGKEIVESEKHQHPTRPTASKSNKEIAGLKIAGSKVLNHKESIKLEEGNKYLSSDSGLIEKVKEMAKIIKKMYDLYDDDIQLYNQKYF